MNISLFFIITLMDVQHYLYSSKERDTSCTPISLPALTGMPFPKVLHRSETDCQVIHSFQSSRINLVYLNYQGEFEI